MAERHPLIPFPATEYEHDQLLQRADKAILESERLVDELWSSMRKAKRLHDRLTTSIGSILDHGRNK